MQNENIIKEAQAEAEKRYPLAPYKSVATMVINQTAELRQQSFTAAIEWLLAHLAPRLETVWREVKVSHGNPTKDGFYYVLYNDGERGNDWFRAGRWYSERNENNPSGIPIVTAWLEPVTTIAQESDAVGFMLFCFTYCTRYNTDMFFSNECENNPLIKNEFYTTAQLYTIYKSTLPSNR